MLSKAFRGQGRPVRARPSPQHRSLGPWLPGHQTFPLCTLGTAASTRQRTWQTGRSGHPVSPHPSPADQPPVWAVTAVQAGPRVHPRPAVGPAPRGAGPTCRPSQNHRPADSEPGAGVRVRLLWQGIRTQTRRPRRGGVRTEQARVTGGGAWAASLPCRPWLSRWLWERRWGCPLSPDRCGVPGSALPGARAVRLGCPSPQHRCNPSTWQRAQRGKGVRLPLKSSRDRWRRRRQPPQDAVPGAARDVSSRLLFVAEEQGRGISPAARGPPGCPLPSPAPSTHHLLRRPQRPLTGSQPRRPPLATRAGGCEVPGARRVGSRDPPCARTAWGD